MFLKPTLIPASGLGRIKQLLNRRKENCLD